MDPQKMQHICQLLILAGTVVAALGTYGHFHYGKQARNKELPEQNGGVVVTDPHTDKQMNIGKIETIHGDLVQGDKVEINVDQRTSASYVRGDASLRSMVLDNLEDLLSRHGGPTVQVVIEVEAGNSLRDKVASDMGEILSERGLGHYAKGNTWIGRFPDHPITVICSQLNVSFAKELVSSIKPLIEGEVGFLTDLQSDEIIKMYINGTPTFSAKGEVRIE